MDLAQQGLFNTHDIILMFTAFQALFMSVLFLIRQASNRSFIFLSVFLTMQFSIAIYLMLFYSATFTGLLPSIFKGYEGVPLNALFMFEGPMLYWYTKSRLYRDFSWHRNDYLPFLMFLCLFLIYPFTPFIYQYFPNVVDVDLTIRTVCQSISILYCVLAILQIRQYTAETKDKFADVDEISMRWLKLLTIGFICVWAWRGSSYIAFNLFGVHVAAWIGETSNYAIACQILFLSIFSMSYSIVMHDGKLEYAAGRPNRAPNYSQDLVHKLEILMQNEKPYLNSDMSLDALASRLEVHPKMLSVLLNRHYKKNFYEFVNHYRIKEALKLLESPQYADASIQDIFESAGFNSKSTFNTFFKAEVGYTPSEYRRRSQLDLSASSV